MRSRRSNFARYVVAVASTLAALTLALLIDPIRLQSPYFLFYAAVALSSWYGGLGPGLVATALGAALGAYFVLPAAGSPVPLTTGDYARFVLFTLVGVLIASLNGQLHKANARCEVEARAARIGEARAKRLAESNLIAVFFSDLDGNIRWGNEAFVRLIGWTGAELAGSNLNWRDLTVPEHRHRDERAIGEVKRCRICKPFEKENLRRDGRRIPVLMGCAMLDDSDDECVAFVVDLTEQKRAEAQVRAHQARLNALASELMKAEERERRRLAVVLHDSVNATLALAKRKVYALQQAGRDGDPVAGLLDVGRMIDEAIQRTRSLTSELSPPVLYELGLAPALQWLGERFEAEHGVECDFDTDDQPKPIGDETRLVLFQGARELLTNAVRHGRAGHCRISLRRDGPWVRVTVADDGRGFDPGANGYSAGRSGGFGLFNIRERLLHLSGRLEMNSGPGRGTTATLVAPIRGETAATTTAAAAAPHVEGVTDDDDDDDDDDDHQDSPGR